MSHVVSLNLGDGTPWLAPGVLDLRARFGKIVDLGEHVAVPFIADMVGVALWNMTQVDGNTAAWSSIQTTIAAWGKFCRFLATDLEQGWPAVATSRDLTPDHVIRFADHLAHHYPNQSTRSGIFYCITGCLNALRANRPELLADNFIAPVFPERMTAAPGVRREPYTDKEMFEIVRVCRTEIQGIIHRFRMAKKLIAAGQDPSGRKANAWLSQENVLWYVHHVLNGTPFLASCVDKSAHSSLGSAFGKSAAGYPSRDDTYAYLYPHIEDLTPFILLLHALLDENHQCIMDLNLGDIEPTEDGRLCRIRFVKTRPMRKEFTKLYSNTSIWSPGRIIDMVKLITMPLRRWTHDPGIKDRLWVFLGRRGEAVHVVADGEPTRMVMLFGKKHGITDLQLSRFRVTNLSKAYRRTGSLALVKDRARHRQMQTTVHYLANPGTLDLHRASIATAQAEALNLLDGVVIAAGNEEAEVDQVKDLLHVATDTARRIVGGEQDVFVAACRDFLNRPGGPPNSPCDRPFACFSCRNAVWTSRILPRLIRFRDFLIEQRQLLAPEEWQLRFGFPYRAIMEVILPAFRPEIISLAEAAAPTEPFHVPASMRVG